VVTELVNVDVRIEAIRFKGNGTIFTGCIIDDDGTQTGEEIVVRCPESVLYPRQEVFRGELWTVSGFTETYQGEPQLRAIKAFLKRPTGENLIAAIAFNSKFAGIGEKKARDLWATFGEDVYDMLDAEEPDIEALQQILNPEATERLLRVWKEEYSSDLYRWMDNFQIPKTIGRRLQEYYGKDARSKVEEDPYRILAFGQSWKKVDTVARRLGVADNDPRRLHAAVADVLYRHFADGHTALSTETLTKRVAGLLGGNDKEGHCLACNALKHTYADGAFVRNGDVWQATGVFLIEAFVADRIHRMLASQDTNQGGLFDPIFQKTINHFEDTEHQLGNEQKAAVQLALKTNCCVITGGAGVGKTSVLRCLYDVIEEENGTIIQMALSGRAAKRLEEASGRSALTIAGFLTKIKQEDLEKVTHAVVDEASMLDIVSTYQILRKLPERIGLILVGDPYQLPPIGPGLTFHILTEEDQVPVARLTKVYRQSGESGIPAIADAIRKGEWPTIPKYTGIADGVFAVQAGPDEISNLLPKIYEKLGGDDASEEVQILSAIKADNAYGVVGINKSFHARYTEGENLVLVKTSAGNLKDSGFRQSDRIVVTENQWDRRLFNGSLGYIKEAFKTPRLIEEGRHAVANAIIDGREIQLTQDDLTWIIYAYSISVHKSQGSQFKRVIIPICKSRLLDRTLIYTAITRGVNQVVLIGDLAVTKSAVEAPPHAWRRQIGFRQIMGRLFSRE
jgi:exodeoxyribonuclease V alpha subunit